MRKVGECLLEYENFTMMAFVHAGSFFVSVNFQNNELPLYSQMDFSF